EANSGVIHMVWSKFSSPLLGYARGDVVSGNLQTESLNEISNSRTISVALGSDGAPRLAGQDPYNAQDVAFMLPLDMTDLDANGFTYIEEEALLHLPMTTGGPPGPRFEWQQSGGQTYP